MLQLQKYAADHILRRNNSRMVRLARDSVLPGASADGTSARKYGRKSLGDVSLVTDRRNKAIVYWLPGRTAVCLAIPGKILEIQEQSQMRAARVQFGGIVRQVSLDFVPEAGLGDYVMVHVGFAISRVDASEAERTYKLLEEMGALEAELPPAEA